MISYGTSQITSRLDRGRDVAERFTKIGMVVAGLAGVVSPLSLLTSYYGMNVQEITPGATKTLYDFWSIGIPMFLILVVCSGFVAIWMLTNSKSPSDHLDS